MSFYETKGGSPSRSDIFSKFIHLTREAQSQAALLGHLYQAQGQESDKLIGQGWLGISELLGRLVIQCTEMATKGSITR